MTTAPTDSANTETADAVGIRSSALFALVGSVVCADCMEIVAEMPDKCIDAVITDPPYGTTRNKWDVPMDIEKWWAEIQRICRGAVVMTAAQPFTTDIINGNRKWFRWADVWKRLKQLDS